MVECWCGQGMPHCSHLHIMYLAAELGVVLGVDALGHVPYMDVSGLS